MLNSCRRHIAAGIFQRQRLHMLADRLLAVSTQKIDLHICRRTFAFAQICHFVSKTQAQFQKLIDCNVKSYISELENFNIDYYENFKEI